MEAKLKHLELIQGIINRMGYNEFLLKGWSVVLVSALFALAAAGSNQIFIYLAYFPALAFWVLDGYFLWQERLFRRLYDKVRLMDEADIDFSMDTSSVAGQVKPWREVTVSKTLKIFHGTIIGTIFIVMIVTIIIGLIK